MAHDPAHPALPELVVASDHAGVAFKAALVEGLKQAGYHVEDLGPSSLESVDYPDYARRVCEKIQHNPKLMGVLICGSGIGMSIAANKFAGIRAALVCSEPLARLARQHNNANVLCLGAREQDPQQALVWVKAWLTASFEGGRHDQRLRKLHDTESR